MVATVLVVIAATRWSTAQASFLVAVVASQMLSPLLWDHYAIVLLLPTAYLLEREHWWAIAIPLATALPFVGITPPAAYPLAFAVCLVAPAVVGFTRAGTTGRATASQPVR
jgi:hypothetical protein